MARNPDGIPSGLLEWAMGNKGKAALAVVGLLVVAYILLARACGGAEGDGADVGVEGAGEDVEVVASIPVTVLPVNAVNVQDH